MTTENKTDETPEPVVDPTKPAAEPDDDAEVAQIALDAAKAKNALIGHKKENRELKAKIKELEAATAKQKELEERLDRAAPVINAVLSNPKLAREVHKAVAGTHTSSEKTEQTDDDPDAEATAEDLGLYLSDGVTLDIARARRVLDRVDTRTKKLAQETVRPFASLSVNQQAEQNIARAKALTDNDGVPLASAESIDEIRDILPAHLLANPQVVELVVNNAIGLDRRKGRTPRAQDEPLILDSPGGRRRQEPAVDPAMKAKLERLGLTEKQFTDASRKVEDAVANRKSIALGGK